MPDKPKYRKYIQSRDGRVDMDPIIAPAPLGRFYKVRARRAGGTHGIIEVSVRAESAEEAMKIVREGDAPGIGLGWVPFAANPS